MSNTNWKKLYENPQAGFKGKHLSMVLSSSYTGMALIDPGENTIGECWYTNATDFDAARDILCEKLDVGDWKIDTATLALEGDNYLLHPKKAFDETLRGKLLEFHTGKAHKETRADVLLQVSAAGIYPEVKEQLAPLFQQVPQVQVVHQASVFAEAIARIEYGSDELRIYIFPTEGKCRISIFQSGKLLFSNSFKADNHTDIIYYALLAIDQLELERPKVSVVCIGLDPHSKDELEDDLKRFLEVANLPGSVISNSNPNLDKELITEHFIMFHQHLCV